MGQYLIDNNAISNFFSAVFNAAAMNFMAEVIDDTPIISVITQIESLSWVNPDRNKEQLVKEFIQDATILELTPSVVTQCVRIRRNRSIKTPDAIVAATAIIHNLTLITSDKGFENIQGLTIIDPFTL
jgi:predicted nucleic acid-binding protein